MPCWVYSVFLRDYRRWNLWCSFSVVRSKKNDPMPKIILSFSSGWRCEQRVVLTDIYTPEYYPINLEKLSFMINWLIF
jgi:hypothetical protein